MDDFLNAIADERKRNDSYAVLELMKNAIGEEPKMWGGSIIGHGNMRYKSPTTNREVEWFRIGFSPRKASITLYLMGGLEMHAVALEKLGKHKTGVGCLYISKLADVDLEVLRKMVKASLKFTSTSD